MDYNFLYGEIKNEVSHADSKLGIRISFLALFMTLIATILVGYKCYWWIVAIVEMPLIIEVLIATFGVFPQIKKEFGKSTIKKEPEKINEYFFSDIASFSDFVAYREYIHNKQNPKKLDDDLLRQIYINSKIASRKYKYYRNSWIFFWCAKVVKWIIKSINNKTKC